MNSAKLVVGHRQQRVTGPHPERSLVLPRRSWKAGRHTDEQHPFAVVPILLDGNPLVQLIEEASLRTPRLVEGAGSHDLTGPFIGHAEHKAAAALVGQRDAVLDQLFEMETPGRRLELDAGTFWAFQQSLKFVQRYHRGISALAISSAKS